MTFFRMLWQDEQGFIVSAELIAIGTLMIVGLTVGLHSIQRTAVEEIQDVAGAIRRMDQSYHLTGLRTRAIRGHVPRAMTAGMHFVDLNSAEPTPEPEVAAPQQERILDDMRPVQAPCNCRPQPCCGLTGACGSCCNGCSSAMSTGCGGCAACCGAMTGGCGAGYRFNGRASSYSRSCGSRNCDGGPFSYTREILCTPAYPICPPSCECPVSVERVSCEPACSTCTACPGEDTVREYEAVAMPGCGCNPCTPSNTHLIW